MYNNKESQLSISNLYTSKGSNLWQHRLLNKAKNPRLADRVKTKRFNFGGRDNGQGQSLLWSPEENPCAREEILDLNKSLQLNADKGIVPPPSNKGSCLQLHVFEMFPP